MTFKPIVFFLTPENLATPKQASKNISNYNTVFFGYDSGKQ